MSNPQINDTGFTFNLIHYLWLPDYCTSYTPYINMPHTIQFVKGDPIFWYFSVNGRILRKTKDRLNQTHILEVFDKFSQEICAVWIEDNCFTYLNKQQLFDFFKFGEIDEKTGYLQQFVYPHGQNNFVIHVIWSKELCIQNVIRNKNKILDKQIDIYQRVVTFEEVIAPVSSIPLKIQNISRQIDQQCSNIACHLFNNSKETVEIRQMEIYFKINEKQKLIYLFSKQIQLKGQQKSKNQVNLKLPSKISQIILNSNPTYSVQKDQKCISCNEQRNIQDFHKVQIKDILPKWFSNHWDKQDQIAQDKQIQDVVEGKLRKKGQTQQSAKNIFVNFQVKLKTRLEIPEMIKKIYPYMAVHDFLKELENDYFLNTEFKICTECFLNKAIQNEDQNLKNAPEAKVDLPGYMKKRLAKLILSDKTPKNRIVKNNNSSSIETVYKLRNRSMDLTNYSKRFYLPDKLRDRVASQKNISQFTTAAHPSFNNQ